MLINHLWFFWRIYLLPLTILFVLLFLSLLPGYQPFVTCIEHVFSKLIFKNWFIKTFDIQRFIFKYSHLILLVLYSLCCNFFRNLVYDFKLIWICKKNAIVSFRWLLFLSHPVLFLCYLSLTLGLAIFHTLLLFTSLSSEALMLFISSSLC